MTTALSLFEQVADAHARGRLDDFRRHPTIPRVKVSGDALLDKPVTLRDLMQGGIVSVKVGSDVLGKGGVEVNGSGEGSIFSGDLNGSTTLPTLNVPPTPTDLRAAGTFRAVILTWLLEEYANHSFTEIWRNTVNNLGTAVQIGQAKPNIYVDATALLGVTYFYWVRAVGGPPATAPGSFNAVGGTSGGAGLIGSTDLGPLIVEAGNLASGAVTGPKIAASAIAVGSAAIENGAIRNALIENLAVDTAKIADLAVAEAKIGNLAVTTGKIQDLAVTNAKIANLAVTNAKINDLHGDKITANTLNADRIVAGSITTDRLQVNSVTAVQDGASIVNTTPFGSTNSVFFDTTAYSMTPTGAPVKTIAYLDIRASGLSASVAAVIFTGYILVGGSPAVNGGTASQFSIVMPLSGFQWAFGSVPLVTREVYTAGVPLTFGLRGQATFIDATGLSVNTTGNFEMFGYMVTEENKV